MSALVSLLGNTGVLDLVGCAANTNNKTVVFYYQPDNRGGGGGVEETAEFLKFLRSFLSCLLS